MNSLRTGFTTGACAAAAAKAAAIVLTGKGSPTEVEIGFPDGSRISLPLVYARSTATGSEAAVRKDAGDDPDVTNGIIVIASLAWLDGGIVRFSAGEGVGIITMPGLSVPVGEPAINPVPRRMICEAVKEVTDKGVSVEISLPGGREIAEKTFNPRLGVKGGLSILGTTGIVRPFSNKVLRDALKCSLDVASAVGVSAPVFVPGHIGERAARNHFKLSPEQVVEVSNEWGYMLDCAMDYPFTRLLAIGHPGKLAKLCSGQWDTHSSRSDNAVDYVMHVCEDVLPCPPARSVTVEGLFAALSMKERNKVGNALAARIRAAITTRLHQRIEVSIVLVNMQGEITGSDGELNEWL